MKNIANLLFSVGAVLVTAMGGYSAPLQLLLVLILTDVITGTFTAAKNRSQKSNGGGLSSQSFAKGIFKKITVLFMIAVCYQLDLVFGFDYIRDASIFFFVADELISLTENAGLLGVPMPPKLLDAIDILKDGGKSAK